MLIEAKADKLNTIEKKWEAKNRPNVWLTGHIGANPSKYRSKTV